MAATNSTNKILSGDSQNCDVTLSGQPADKNLSVKVSAAHTVKYAPSTSNVSLVSQTQSQVLKDSNNVPYRTDSAQYSWKHNRNTQGSIDGTISIKASRNASYTGESFKHDATGATLYDGALPLTVTGIKYVATSDQRSEREDNVKITCTVPVSTSTNDLHGGTYSFTSDMNSKDGWADNIRGMFQTYYNQDEPQGHLSIVPKSNGTSAFFDYIGGKWLDIDEQVEVTPCVAIDQNMPLIKYGDVSGKLSMIHQNSKSSTPSQSIYSFYSTSTFNTTPSDKSHSTANPRDITVNYEFSRDDSRNTNTDKGSFIVHQEGGKIDPLDPEISYTWTLTPGDKTESVGQYVKFNKYTSTYQGKKDDGNYQSFSYTMRADVVPLSSMDGKKGSLNGTIKFPRTFTTNGRANKLSTSTLAYSNSNQTEDRKYKMTCYISTNYVTNDTITPRQVSRNFTVGGAKWTYYPQVKLSVKVSYIDGNGNESTNLPKIPGTTNYPSISLSSNGTTWYGTDGYLNSHPLDYVLKSGDGKYNNLGDYNGTIELSNYKLYIKMSDNSPQDSNGGGNSGAFSSDITIDNSSNYVKLSSSSHAGVIKITPNRLSMSPSMRSSFPAITWKLSASVSEKTSDSTGTVTVDSNYKSARITQPKVEASVSTYTPAKVSITLPDFCYFNSGSSDTLTWNQNDVTSAQYTYFTIKENPREDFLWEKQAVVNTQYSKFTTNSGSSRQGKVTITMPSGTTGSTSQTIQQNIGDLYGHVKVESIKGYQGDLTAGKLLAWDEKFTMLTPSANSPKYSYTASMSIQSGATNNQISSDGATITGTITTGGSASDGDPIECYAKFVLTGTNNDNAYYGFSENYTERGYHVERTDINGQTATLTATDYDVRCTYDNGQKKCDVTVDKSKGTFSITIDPNNSSAASISSIEWADPNGDHNNDMMSSPYKVTATKGGTVASTKTYKLEIKPAGGSWQTAHILTQPAGNSNGNTSASQGFTVSVSDNCQVTVDSMSLSISSGNSASSTGPKVTLITGNSSDGSYTTNRLPTGCDVLATINIDNKSDTISFFSTSSDVTIELPVYYGGSISGKKVGFGFKYKAGIYPNGKPNMVSGYGLDTPKYSKNGIVTDCKCEYSADNKNWTDFTSANGQHIKLVFKSSEINTRSTSDKVYTKTGYARIVDSGGNVLASTTGTATLTVAKVQYYNS